VFQTYPPAAKPAFLDVVRQRHLCGYIVEIQVHINACHHFVAVICTGTRRFLAADDPCSFKDKAAFIGINSDVSPTKPQAHILINFQPSRWLIKVW
jgi:hypothetical protein